MNISVMAMAYSLLVTSVLSQIINSWPNKKMLNYSYLLQLKDMLPQIFLSSVMGVLVYCLNFAGLNDWITLVLQALLGILIYVSLSKVFKIESFNYIWGMVSKRLKKT